MSVKDCLILFKLVPAKTENSNVQTLSFLPDYGVLVASSASHHLSEIESWLKEEEVSGENLNKSFFKSWETAKEISDEDRLREQIMHYYSTYGFKAMGVYSDEYIYLPPGQTELPEPLPVLVIEGSSRTSLASRCIDLLNGVALEQKTIERIFNVLEFLGYNFNAERVSHLRNKEARAIAAKRFGILPTDPDDLFRYIYLDATGGKSLVIKNQDTYDKIAETRYQLPTLSTDQLRQLAHNFNRHKPIWLAIKKAHSNNAPIVNAISRRSKTEHRPLPKNPLDELTNPNLGFSREEIISTANRVSLARLVRAYNGVSAYYNADGSRFYMIRNGKGYATHKDRPNLRALISHKRLLRTLISSRINLIFRSRPKIYMPNFIDYAYPTSEKQFVGNYPTGTRIDIPKSEEYTLVGIYWKGSGDDLDLSGVSGSHKVGWDRQWNSVNSKEEHDVMYSGDVTSAPNGATEFLYAKDIERTYLVKVNAYSVAYPEGYPYKLILGHGSNIKKNHIIDPSKVVFSADLELAQRETVVGILDRENNDGLSFYLANQGSGIGRVSVFGQFQWDIEQYLLAKVRSQLRLSDVLAGYLVDEDSLDEADIDLSPSKISKDTLLSLFDEQKVVAK